MNRARGQRDGRRPIDPPRMAATMTAAGTVLVLVNPRSARAAQDIAAGLDVLAAHGWHPILREANDVAAMQALVRNPPAPVDRILVGGGDGTLNALAEVLVAAGKPVGLLPLGTANDLARGLGIPLDVRAACHVLASGRPRRIDLGWVGRSLEADLAHGKLFVNVAGIGVSADVARTMAENRDRNSRWGVLAYPLALISVLWRRRPFRVRLWVDGRFLALRCHQVSIGNGVFHGGGMRVAEGAAIDDARLEVNALQAASPWRLLRHLPDLRAGRHHAWREAVHLRGREVRVETTRPRAINTDGELTAHTPAAFRVVPGALVVMVPPDGGGEALRGAATGGEAT